MSFEHKTTEALRPKDPNSLGSDNVVQFDRIFAVQGPRFQQFLAEVIMPLRQDVAVMALQKFLEETLHAPVGTMGEAVKLAVERAFMTADEFCLTNPTTLDARMSDYFDLYMKRGKIDDILKASMEAAHDYSL